MARKRRKQPKQKILRMTIPADFLAEIIRAVKAGKITRDQGRRLFDEEVERRTVYASE